MRLGLLLVAGLGIVTLISALIPLRPDWLVSFYVPLVIGGGGGLVVWSVILGVVRWRRRLPTYAYLTIASMALFARSIAFFLDRLPAGVPVIMVAASVVTLSVILFQAGAFLGLDRDPRW